MILRACISRGGFLLEFPSIVFVDACQLQKLIKPDYTYPPD